MRRRNHTQEIGELKCRLAVLPDTEEPPLSTLQILGRSRQERDWQRLLCYFLTPDNPHGLERALLDHVLQALSDRDDLEFTYSRFDRDTIQVQQEVITDTGRPDAVCWSSNDWFVLWELKVDAAEGDDQTPRYVDIDAFRSIDLEAAAEPDAHYLYLAPGQDDPPTADEFTHISWEWIASELQSFVADARGAYPARTTAQIDDFIDTIRTELTMAEYQENQQEKVGLYIDHYDEIAAVKAAFDDRWETFTTTWGDRLVETIDEAVIVDDESVPDEYVCLRLAMTNGERRHWIFRQGQSDWSWLFPRAWWTKLDESRPIADRLNPNGRVGFLHRLDFHRDDALTDHELVFYLRNAPSGHESFYRGFAQRFNGDDDIPSLLPATTT